MPAERVAAIREENNNTSVDRLFLEEAGAGEPIPNPIENFEQCFSEYPDLLSTFFPRDFCRRTRVNCCYFFRWNKETGLWKAIADSVASLASFVEGRRFDWHRSNRHWQNPGISASCHDPHRIPERSSWSAWWTERSRFGPHSRAGTADWEGGWKVPVPRNESVSKRRWFSRIELNWRRFLQCVCLRRWWS